MKTLLINAHPDFNNDSTYTAQMKAMFLEKYNEAFPNGEISELNLYEGLLPRLDSEQLLNVWNKLGAGTPLSEEEQQVADKSTFLVQQFKAHHRIVILTPLHNFNITSRLKDYIDNIMIPRETFKYTDDGSVGLMTDDYKALLLQASGGIYTNEDRYTPLEFSYHYLREMFKEVMGFDEFYIARAQGTSILPKEDIIKDAAKDIDQVFDAFYS
ncbi:NAD(P)H-dependent oxidoreductase [Staphylococcus warneri]|mgnify:FL=1|uniref:FMN-dependent NADH-azoreductase n=4 Tax=Staphylococcus TaxID=1279 RepID=UPI00066B2881|nr:NAD(P)H-dependent oxidoreductase [Staphylococcus warneri]AXZ22241.1 FMN-dependent NADH-azoreductase [Staphylococcus warneri]KTW09573.1 FMN-dependent NADH-azoreductase [Staphylococcus warneri]OIS42250.1 FMN-dependent NADH-azoreductase [Staphylococcus warneri]PTI07792.1 FMN-dependent NADH-azoreductase [Staphylococcus warneri]PTI33254.1 FMN-dependent NADH-azoreductase [Staphylococcus warneri]